MAWRSRRCGEVPVMPSMSVRISPSRLCLVISSLARRFPSLPARKPDQVPLAHFLGGRPREIALGPDNPVPDLLVGAEALVGPFYRRGRVRLRTSEDQHGHRFGTLRAVHANHGAGADLGLLIENSFDIRGVDVQACRRDDDFLAPASEIEVAPGIPFA